MYMGPSQYSHAFLNSCKRSIYIKKIRNTCTGMQNRICHLQATTAPTLADDAFKGLSAAEARTAAEKAVKVSPDGGSATSQEVEVGFGKPDWLKTKPTDFTRKHACVYQ